MRLPGSFFKLEALRIPAFNLGIFLPGLLIYLALRAAR